MLVGLAGCGARPSRQGSEADFRSMHGLLGRQAAGKQAASHYESVKWEEKTSAWCMGEPLTPWPSPGVQGPPEQATTNLKTTEMDSLTV